MVHLHGNFPAHSANITSSYKNKQTQKPSDTASQQTLVSLHSHPHQSVTKTGGVFARQFPRTFRKHRFFVQITNNKYTATKAVAHRLLSNPRRTFTPYYTLSKANAARPRQAPRAVRGHRSIRKPPPPARKKSGICRFIKSESFHEHRRVCSLPTGFAPPCRVCGARNGITGAAAPSPGLRPGRNNRAGSRTRGRAVRRRLRAAARACRP